jgi:hypothetical protein
MRVDNYHYTARFAFSFQLRFDRASGLEKSMADFRVIEGGGDWDLAEQELADALREAAANVLRVVRGAGKPHALVNQFGEVIGAAVKFKEAAGHWPPSHLMTRALALDNEVSDLYDRCKSGQIDQESIDRWKRDGTFERMRAEGTIHRGVLHIVASNLLGQKVQASAGDSEMYQGIRDVIEARELQRESRDERLATPAPQKRGRKRTPAPSKPRQREK